MKSQNEEILKHLKKNKTINPIQALNEFSCFRLAARIGDLRQAGHQIISSIKKRNGKRYAEYQLTDKSH